MEKGSLLRRSGVSFRSAAEESRIVNRSDACTPGPSSSSTSTPGPSKPTKPKRKADKEQLEIKNQRKNRKTSKSLSIAKMKIWGERKN